ncbi:hypothetical protein [Fibrella aquatilis]|uniref:Uncharacterized protein n=1 Tax=Fibrella aquatilis TaxID=2817059 RepID=A0A939JYI3_9BACT|nr:hypothetical protein [Fibrella aquatilis]MBO0932124.1 hypothetical protein [Fibrella aquatilis]
MIAFLCICVAGINVLLIMGHMIRLYRHRHDTSIAEATDSIASILFSSINASVLVMAYNALV